MVRSKALWRTIGLIGGVATIGMVAGLIYAINQIVYPQGDSNAMRPPTQTTTTPTNDRIEIVAIGDSLTVGFGDTTGKGYVGRFRELWNAQSDKPVYVTANFARNGYKTTDVLNDLQQRVGLQEALREADVVLMTAGGNDLYQFGEDIVGATFESRIPKAQQSLQGIFTEIRKHNPKAIVYYVALYNPFITLSDGAETSRAVQRWNTTVQELANTDANTVIVPTFDLFQQKMATFLSSDQYHLNDMGYARVADRLMTLIP